MSSNPTGGILIKFFPYSLFGDVFFHVPFYYYLCVVCLFVLIFRCVVFFGSVVCLFVFVCFC